MSPRLERSAQNAQELWHPPPLYPQWAQLIARLNGV